MCWRSPPLPCSTCSIKSKIIVSHGVKIFVNCRLTNFRIKCSIIKFYGFFLTAARYALPPCRRRSIFACSSCSSYISVQTGVPLKNFLTKKWSYKATELQTLFIFPNQNRSFQTKRPVLAVNQPFSNSNTLILSNTSLEHTLRQISSPSSSSTYTSSGRR